MSSTSDRDIEAAKIKLATSEAILDTMEGPIPKATVKMVLAAKDELVALQGDEITELLATTEATAIKVKFRKDEAGKKDKEIADLKTSNAELKTSNAELLHIAKASTLSISRSMAVPDGCSAFCIAVFPDDSFAVACKDGYVRVYSSTGDLQYSMSAHEGQAVAVAVLPGGRLATGGQDFKVKLWTQDTCDTVLTGHTNTVFCLAVLEDDTLASGSRDNTIRLWKDGSCVAVLKGHAAPVYCLAVLVDGRLASAGTDMTIRLWSKEGKAEEKVLEGHTDGIMSLVSLPDGGLASGACDNTIRVWRDGSCEATLTGHTHTVVSLCSLPGGLLASGGGSQDQKIRIWRLPDLDCVATLPGAKGGLQSLASLLDGTVVSGPGLKDDQIRLWRSPLRHLGTSTLTSAASTTLDSGSGAGEGPRAGAGSA